MGRQAQWGDEHPSIIQRVKIRFRKPHADIGDACYRHITPTRNISGAQEYRHATDDERMVKAA